jgi:hypothetical protein
VDHHRTDRDFTRFKRALGFLDRLDHPMRVVVHLEYRV